MTEPSAQDKRRHPRYSAVVPVAFTLGEVVASESAYLNNISVGGVAFDSMVELATGTMIMLHLPPTKPVFRIPARVVWCRKMSFQYAVGVEFVGTDLTFRNRMVDVVRRIEEYREETARSGRRLTAQEATIEWIALFGSELATPG
jgi:Tfp pilus assembly protein PilZ